MIIIHNITYYIIPFIYNCMMQNMSTTFEKPSSSLSWYENCSNSSSGHQFRVSKKNHFEKNHSVKVSFLNQ